MSVATPSRSPIDTVLERLCKTKSTQTKAKGYFRILRGLKPGHGTSGLPEGVVSICAWFASESLRDKQVTVTAAQKSSSIAPKIFWKSVSDINGLLLKVSGGSAGDLGPDGHSIKLDYPPLPLFDPPCDYCVSVGVSCGRTHASQKCCPCVLRRKGCARDAESVESTDKSENEEAPQQKPAPKTLLRVPSSSPTQGDADRMNLFSYAISRSIGIPKQQPLPITSKPTEVPSTEPTWTPLEQTTSNNTDSRPIGPPRASTSQAASQTSRSASGSKIKGKAPALTIVTDKNAAKSKQSQLQQTRLSGGVPETVSEGEVVPLVVTARGDKEVLLASSAFKSSELPKRPTPPSPVGDNPAKKRRVETSASREEHSLVQSASSSRPLTRTRAERPRTVSTASSNDPELDDLLPESYANLISIKKLPTPRRNSTGKSQTISPTASKYPNRLRPRLPSPTPSADSPTFGRRSNEYPVANSAAANERLLGSLFSPSGDQDRSDSGSSNILQHLVNAQASRIIDYVQNRGCGDIMLKMKVLDLKTRLSELDKLTEKRDNPGRSGNSGKDRLIGKLKDMVLTAQEEMVEIVQKEGCPDIELKLMILDLNTRLTEFKKVGQGS